MNSSCNFETFHPRMGLCFTATDVVCTKAIYIYMSLLLLRYIISNIQICRYINLKQFVTFVRCNFSVLHELTVDPRVSIGLQEIFNNLQMPMTTRAMQGFFLEKWNPAFWATDFSGKITTLLKFNMEPKNDDFQKKSRISMNLLLLCAIFR